jgi:hypothetical protein
MFTLSSTIGGPGARFSFKKCNLGGMSGAGKADLLGALHKKSARIDGVPITGRATAAMDCASLGKGTRRGAGSSGNRSRLDHATRRATTKGM